jgi:hypothetical protein
MCREAPNLVKIGQKYRVIVAGDNKTSMKMCREGPNLVKIGQKYRFIVAGDTKSP